MSYPKNLSIIFFVLTAFGASAQSTDSSSYLKEVIVTGYKTLHGIGHLLELKDGIIYAGKKNEVILVDSLDANKSLNNTRQILGRIPGLTIVETESSGFTANGIASRGLNPSQSIEMNTRQNGYNISADVYGYNEAYYLPPMEGVQRIELVRGAAALQFGAQFGGMVNYVLEEPPKGRGLQFFSSQTFGSYGLCNFFNSLGGHYKKLSYYGFLQYRSLQGYRPNSEQWQLSGYGKLVFNPGPRLSLGLEYSLLRNSIHMPGGLSDSLFKVQPRASLRARNWLASPWNVLSSSIHFTPRPGLSLDVKTTYLFSSRNLVWRNEDGGPAAPDTPDPATGQYIAREVERETMHSIATEARLALDYSLGNLSSTLAGGARVSYGWFDRLEGGEGSTGTDFDLSIAGDWETRLRFHTFNVAPFVENIFRLGTRFTITPGLRLEGLNSSVRGYSSVDQTLLYSNGNRYRRFLLAGLGLEYRTGANGSFYGSISQAYRPIEYSQLQPFGSGSKIDPNLKDARGFNSDLGWRATVKNYLNLDAGLFYLAYNNRVGLLLKTDPQTGEQYSYRTNVAASVHRGLETYVEFNILQFVNPHSRQGLSVFNSLAWMEAKYTSGEFRGNRVEAAPKLVERLGLNYSRRWLSATFQVNDTGDAFGDGTNTRVSENPVGGYLPAYTVMDISFTGKFNHYTLKAGVNNLADRAYFTRRTDEYPGPGIIPAVGRSFYLGFSVKF